MIACILWAAGCGKSDRAANDGNAQHTSTAAGAQSTAAAVPTANVPDDPCALLTVAEVEAVVGPLVAPPRRDDGCRYTLQIPAEVAERRRKAIELKEKFRKMGASDLGGAMANFESDPNSYAVVLSINPKGDVSAERGVAAAERKLTEGNDGSAVKLHTGAADRWDNILFIPYGFAARVGHLQVLVQGQAPDVDDEAMKALAAAARDKIPDLPFASDEQEYASDPDPCGLLSRADAEAILGKLIVPPYRTLKESPLANLQGASCAYFTAGHHVLVLTPTRSGGEQTYKAVRGIGALAGIAMGQQAHKIDGPWDHAIVDTTTGEFVALKGDAMLQVAFLTSTIDQQGAMEIAKRALPHL